MQYLFKKLQLPLFLFSLNPDQSCYPASHLPEWGRVHLSFSRGCSMSLSSGSISAACPQCASLHVYGIWEKAILTAFFLSLNHPPFLQNASYFFVSSLYSFHTPVPPRIWPGPDVSCPQKGYSVLTATACTQRCSKVDISHKHKYTLDSMNLLCHSCLRPEALSRKIICFLFLLWGSLLHSFPFPQDLSPLPLPHPLGDSDAMTPSSFPLR